MTALVAAPAAAIIPLVATVGGATVAARRPPTARTRSLVHHAAAGAVFAAVASELIIDLIERGRVWPVAVGFAVGTVAMLILRVFAERIEARSGASPIGLLVALSLDILVDGAVLGIGFALGARGGWLLTAALTLELLFLGLSVASAFARPGSAPRRVVGATFLLALLLPLGAAVGAFVGRVDELVIPVLAFGAAALLYLVTEELLVEAHGDDASEGPVPVAAFFAAFLAILLLDIGTR